MNLYGEALALWIVRDINNASTALERYRSSVNAIPHFLHSINGARRKISQERIPVIRWLIGDMQRNRLMQGDLCLLVRRSWDGGRR